MVWRAHPAPFTSGQTTCHVCMNRVMKMTTSRLETVLGPACHSSQRCSSVPVVWTLLLMTMFSWTLQRSKSRFRWTRHHHPTSKAWPSQLLLMKPLTSRPRRQQHSWRTLPLTPRKKLQLKISQIQSWKHIFLWRSHYRRCDR